MALTKLTTDLDNVQGLATRVIGQAATVKQTIDKAGNDIKTYINDTLTSEIDTELATKTTETYVNNKIAEALISPVDVVTDDYLSDTAGQIKDRVATNTTQLTNIANDIDNINQSIETMYTNATASGSIGLDLSLYTIFNLTLSAAITLDITASAVSGNLQSCIVRIKQPASAKVVTFSDTIKWNNDSIADLTTGNKVYILLFHTIDGGTSFVGQMSSQYTV